jgi:hypothetical protein
VGRHLVLARIVPVLVYGEAFACHGSSLSVGNGFAQIESRTRLIRPAIKMSASHPFRIFSSKSRKMDGARGIIAKLPER